jgi:putative nucleotidyltransferase with HDIG domain
MSGPITREEAFDLLRERVQNENLVKHCLATEAIMKKMAERLGEDPDTWAVTGLLHDLDFEETKDSPAEHTKRTVEVLKDRSFPDDALRAIREHNAEGLGIPRESRFGIALACSETITGLIVATALVYPDKKLASVKPKSVRKRMKEGAFARNVNREIIRECERIGLPLDEFIQLSLTAMQGIAAQLGL